MSARLTVDRRATPRLVGLVRAVQCWSGGYLAVLVAVWVAGRPGAPFGTGVAARVAAVGLGALSLVLLVAALRLERAGLTSAGRTRLTALWMSCALLVVVVPTNLVMQLAFSAVQDPLEAALHGGALGGGLLWAALTLRLQRAVGPGCSRCGRTGDAVCADNWVQPPRWLTRSATGGCLVALLGFTVPHWLWALGVPIGTTETEALSQIRGSLWLLGAVPAGGALLTLGLARRWGQVFPNRWPLLGGRTVPRGCAIVPALLVAALLLQYGVMMTGCAGATVTGFTDRCFTADRSYLVRNWAFTATYPVFLCWGLLLGAAALGYRTLTRPRCPTCGHR